MCPVGCLLTNMLTLMFPHTGDKCRCKSQCTTVTLAENDAKVLSMFSQGNDPCLLLGVVLPSVDPLASLATNEQDTGLSMVYAPISLH